MSEIHPAMAKLEKDLESLKLKPEEKEILVDIFGWNNRDGSTPKSYRGLDQPTGPTGLVLGAAVRAVAGEMAAKEIRALLNTGELVTIFIFMTRCHNQSEFADLKDLTQSLTGYLAPELLAIRAREAISRLLMRRMGKI